MVTRTLRVDDNFLAFFVAQEDLYSAFDEDEDMLVRRRQCHPTGLT